MNRLKLMKVTAFPIHTFLIAVYPIVFLFSNNYKETPASYIVVPLLIAAVTTAFFLILGVLIFRNLYKAGLFSTLFVLLFSTYGHLYSLLERVISLFTNHLHLHVIYLLLFAVGVFLIHRMTVYLIPLSKALNFFTVLLIAIPLLNISHEAYQKRETGAVAHNAVPEVQIGNRHINSSLPSIYYIILDGYARADILKTIFNYDNSEFLDYLKKKGFFVAAKSRSNYAQTGLSLPSVLNMEYYTQLENKEKPNVLQLFDTKQGKIIHFLKSIGYKYKYYGTYNDLEMINSIKISDFVNDYTMTLLRGTILVSLERQIQFLFYVSERRERVLSAFSGIAEDAKNDEPTFIFAHILSPHPPYVFNRWGGFPLNSKAIKGGWEYPDNYLDQLIYTNTKVKTLIEGIQKNSKIPPIIIIQSDHGSATTFKTQTDWENPTDEMLQEVFGNLNTYYMPDNCKKNLYDTITPINSFRVVLNCIFKENYEILDDRIYFFHPYHDTKYHFIDVTDRTLLKTTD